MNSATGLKLQLYVLSLFILFALLFVNNVQVPTCYGPDCLFLGWSKLFKENIIPAFCVVGMIAGALIYRNFKYRVVKAAKKNPQQIQKIENMNFETLSFLITYVVPLVCFDLDFHLYEKRNGLMLVLVMLLMGWIYVTANMFYTNPTLAVLRFRIYKVDLPGEEGIVVITREKLVKGDSIKYRLIDENIYYAKRI